MRVVGEPEQNGIVGDAKDVVECQSDPYQDCKTKDKPQGTRSESLLHVDDLPIVILDSEERQLPFFLEAIGSAATGRHWSAFFASNNQDFCGITRVSFSAAWFFFVTVFFA